jgi:hypothetical protein
MFITWTRRLIAASGLAASRSLFLPKPKSGQRFWGKRKMLNK